MFTEAATRLKATRVSLTEFGVKSQFNAAIAFWLRRFTVSPNPGTNENDAPVKGSNRSRSPKLYLNVRLALSVR